MFVALPLNSDAATVIGLGTRYSTDPTLTFSNAINGRAFSMARLIIRTGSVVIFISSCSLTVESCFDFAFILAETL